MLGIILKGTSGSFIAVDKYFSFSSSNKVASYALINGKVELYLIPAYPI